MTKSKKTSKKEKKSKKEKDRKSTLTEKSTQPVQNFYSGIGTFTLPNGDTYTGDYSAHRSGVIWREGHGCYYTQDGHCYEGLWRDDKLVDLTPLTITYPNGDTFEGTLKKNKYEKGGLVQFKDGVCLNANFEGNKPVGNCHLIDPLGQLWKSYPEEEDRNKPKYPPKDKIFYRPEHVFFNNIHPLRGINREKLADIEPKWSSKSYIGSIDEESDVYLPDEKELENMIFGRKSKVAEDTHDWHESPWYMHFKQYKDTREMILGKIKAREKFTEEEKKWYRSYMICKKQRHQLEAEKLHGTQKTDVDNTLLDQFYSEEHRKKAKPYSIIYPSYYWRVQNEAEEEEMEEELVSEESSPVTTEVLEELTEEGSLCMDEVTEIVEEEEVIPNRSIGCATSSLFNYVQTVTGKQITNTCESTF